MDAELRLRTILSQATSKGADGFNRESVEVFDAPLSKDTDDIFDWQLTNEAWSLAVTRGFIAPKMYTTPETPLLVTDAGHKHLELN